MRQLLRCRRIRCNLSGIRCKALTTEVVGAYEKHYKENWSAQTSTIENNRFVQGLKTGSAVAGALLGYVERGLFDKLTALFVDPPVEADIIAIFDSMAETFDDPYLAFDP